MDERIYWFWGLRNFNKLQQFVYKIKTKVERKIKKLESGQSDQLPFDEEATSDLAKLSIEQKEGCGYFTNK